MSSGDLFQELFAGQITQSKVPIPPSTTSSRKRKRNISSTSEQLQERKHPTTEIEEVDPSVGINRVFSRMNNDLLADYVAQRTRKFEDDLSPVEWGDRYIAGKLFYVTNYQSTD